ncbi:hypothetical protein GCM10008967_33330 [Bacillus carboniphilus]|uniref:DUF4440 domain-containing protein n=1 Tax=Bacillus carboniphilus TaxID=86663 RepID=A0ABN0WK94_9BACI
MLKGLNHFIQEYERATNTHDFAQVRPFIKHDAVYLFSEGTYRGMDEIQHAFERNWRTVQDEVYRITDVEWLSYSESMATCIYHYYWRGVYNGAEREGRGRGTNSMVKEDGKWKMIHEHLSQMPR